MRYVVYLCIWIACYALPAFAQSSPPDTLRLEQALQQALQEHPAAQTAQWRTEAAKGQIRQAGLWPNPVIEVEAEEWSSGQSPGGLFYRLSQDVLLGRKLHRQVQFARRTYEATQYEAFVVQLTVAQQLTEAYFNALVARRRMQLAEQLSGLATRLYATITSMVEAGKLSPVEQQRVRVEKSRAEAQYLEARRSYDVARSQLAAALGQPILPDVVLEDVLDTLRTPPPYDRLAEKLRAHPLLQQLEALQQAAQARERLERARRWPDIGITVGTQQLADTPKRFLTVGFTLPIPLFHRNQGAIQAARATYQATVAEWKNARIALETSLQATYSRLLATYRELQLLKQEALPAAEQAYEAIREGYQQGKFNVLDVLDSQRTFFEIKMQYVDVLARYHRTYIQLQALTGQLLPFSSSN
jgi:cobalt-zinc-cadmium efflux system outer membrane protein